jgi:polar amino acid transport system ATP-binding protein
LKLKISNLSKRFDAHLALDSVSLVLEETHSLVLIGPSGGGKTTLLRILAGLEIPDNGSVEFNGEAVRFQEPDLLHYRRTVGVVFQAFNLFPHLTALENIVLPLEKVHQLAPAQARDVALQLLRRFQLDAHAHKKPAALSGGQRQRVAIARAVAIRPRVVLFDEPTSALDPEMTAEVLDMIEQLREEGTDLILVTHEMGFARLAADRVAFLSQGRVLEFGETRAVFDAPKTEECKRFLGTVLKY